jgi:hypothetical protein
MDDVATLIARIDTLLERPTEDADAEVLAHMEATLTDGYARALALEGEHWRLQREIGAIAAELAHGQGEARTQELAALARKLALSEAELARLREILVSLRDRVGLAARAA